MRISTFFLTTMILGAGIIDASAQNTTPGEVLDSARRPRVEQDARTNRNAVEQRRRQGEVTRSNSTAHRASSERQQVSVREHRVVIQVTQNDPGLMNIALNNAQNLFAFYEQKGEGVKIEFVTYGPGIHMFRADTSPVKDRLSTFALQHPETVFSACGNTLNNQSKQESKEITLVSEARLVPTGIGRVIELQEQGWSYVRP